MILYYQICGAIFVTTLLFSIFWGWLYGWRKEDRTAELLGLIVLLAFLFLIGGGIFQLIGRIF